MSASIRVLLGTAVALILLLGSSEVLGQTPGKIYKSVPGTGSPAFTQPYSTPRYYPPNYGYGYRSPYGSYYRGPRYSVPWTGQPAYPTYPSYPTYPPTYYPPAPIYTAWRLGITGTEWPGVGVRISTMEPGSPAERMGIEVTDVIVQVNGRPIRTMYDLQSAVAASGGYARVLVLDNRTNSYMWHNGSLTWESAVPGAAMPGSAAPQVTTPGV